MQTYQQNLLIEGQHVSELNPLYNIACIILPQHACVQSVLLITL